MRADLALVARGLAPSRSAARRLIEAGAVRQIEAGRGATVRRPAVDIADWVGLEVADHDETRFVSRAGAKLAGALASTGLVVTDFVVLDLGTSTGGFADCLLQAGAARIVGVDVGHGQLHPRLADDGRLRLFEGLNARHLEREQLGDAMPAVGFDLIVADLSFISLTKVLPAVLPLARPDGRLLALVKPQFELGADALDGRGIVRDSARYAGLPDLIAASLTGCGWRLKQFLDSPLPGGDGNREFFALGSS